MAENPPAFANETVSLISRQARYALSESLSVAPMMDWTDRHCRAFHRVLAPHARLYTEMVHAQAVIHGDRERLLGFDGVESPVALQLGGSHPEQLAEAARIGAQWGYDEINLNVGCPSDRVQAGRFGACLMKDPALVAECVAAMFAAVAIPVTVKCRLGVDDQEDYDVFLHFIDTVAAAGCRLFIVHARNAWLQGLSPKENREIPPLRYDWVRRLKRERPSLTIVLNGGLNTVEAGVEWANVVDGVMLGRVAYHEPYRLHEMDVALFGGELVSRDVLLRRYLPYVQAQRARGVALKHMTRHILGLYHAQPGGLIYRQIFSEGMAQSGVDVELFEQALSVVRSLGLRVE